MVKFSEDQGFIVSSGMSFKTIFALIPVTGIFIGILTLFPSFNKYKDKVSDFILKYLIPDNAADFVDVINKFLSQSGTLSVIGIFALIYISLDLFVTIDNQINRTWGIKSKRPFIQKFLIYWALLTVTPLLIAGYFYYSGIMRSMLIPLFTTRDMEWYLISILVYVLLHGFIFFLYYVIPSIKVDLIKALIVSAIVTVCWLVLRFLFNYYTKFAMTNWVIYGSVAVIIFFLIWISFNWIILFFGVELLAVWQEELYLGSFELKKVFVYEVALIISILNDFDAEFKTGTGGVSDEFIAKKYFIDISDIREIFDVLQRSGIIVNGSTGFYHVIRDITSIKLDDVEKMVFDRVINRNRKAPEMLNKIVKHLERRYCCDKEGDLFIGDLLS